MRAGTVVVMAAALAGAGASGLAAQGAGTGGITGSVTTGASPPQPLRVSFDQKICGTELPDASIVVGAAGELANAVVTLVGVRARGPARDARVLNERCSFVPRVQVVGSGATLRTSSRDPVLHTTTLQTADGRQLINLALPVPGMELSRPLPTGGTLRIGCSTHQWMRGWIVVTDDVSAVTGADGRFTLPDVPAGTYTLRVWHESLRAPDQRVTVTAGKSAAVTVAMR